MDPISEIDLILNPDGSVYHLHLHPDEIADTIITVGDPARVEKVSRHFDRIDVVKTNREFHTHTGLLDGKRISVISTGIGTGSIDIVLNELDALVNVDLNTRLPKETRKSLTFIRIGTSCALQPEIMPGDLIVTSFALGLDSLMHYYRQCLSTTEQMLLTGFKAFIPTELDLYIASADLALLKDIGRDVRTGITLTAPGFFGPQGRKLNEYNAFPNLIDEITQASVDGHKITNIEMETAAIYGLSSCFGHKAISFSVIIPNKARGTISNNPEKNMNDAIETILARLSRT